MRPPVLDSDWPPLLRALYDHDMREYWDASLAPHSYNVAQHERRCYMDIAGTMPLKILDVGCAQGTLALLLAEAGHIVTAVDLRQEFLDYAVSRWQRGTIRFVQANAMELDLPERFDLIFANQILEHLVYPLELIVRLAGHLAPAGRLVVTTPNACYLKSTLPTFTDLGDPKAHESKQFFPDGDGHFFAYTPEELRDILVQSDLGAVAVRSFDTPWITGHMKVRYLHGRIPIQVLRGLDRLTLMSAWSRRRFGYQLMGQGRRKV